MTRRERAHKILTNPKTGLFFSKDKVKRVLSEHNINMSDQEIKDTLKDLEVRQIFKKVNKKSIPIICPNPEGGCYQIDITFYDQLKRHNDKNIGVLNMINIISKYAHSKIIKNKTAKEISEKFKEMIVEVKELGRGICCLYSDSGSEFKNKLFSKVVKDNGIHHKMFIGEDNHNTLSIVERFNRTFRTLIEKYLNMNGTNKWIDVHQDLIDNYNNSYHSTIRGKPKEVTKHQEIILNLIKIIQAQEVVESFRECEVGETVRKILKKNLFDKGGERYSKSLYEIAEVKGFWYYLKNKSGNILKNPVHIKNLMIVDPDSLVKVNDNQVIEKEKEFQKVRRTLRKEKLGEVNDKNEIEVSKRLKPRTNSRIIKIPRNIRIRDNIGSDVIGKDKSGTIIKTRKYKNKNKNKRGK